MTARPRIAITVGDPSGIGPEIALKAARDPRVVDACQPAVYGPFRPEELEAFPPGFVDAGSGRASYDAIVQDVADAQD